MDIIEPWLRSASWINKLRQPSLSAEPISLEYALRIFDSLAARNDLAFDYTKDGCAARAHLMCEAVMALGLKAHKAWAFAEKNIQESATEGELIKKISVVLPNNKVDPDLEWDFHVTLALPVRLPNGKVEFLVFDPCFFDGPVLLGDWSKILDIPYYQARTEKFGRVPSEHNYYDYLPGYMSTKKALSDPNGKYFPRRYIDDLLKIKVPRRSVHPSPLRERYSPKPP